MRSAAMAHLLKLGPARYDVAASTATEAAAHNFAPRPSLGSGSLTGSHPAAEWA
jgi:hypothetical protein